jgi:AraC-like DNA-binding protein
MARKTTPIPLIRQIEASAVVDLLHEAGAPVDRLLHEAALPAGIEAGGDGYVAARTMLQFVGHAADSQGIPDLCWRAASRAPIQRLGGWGAQVARCTTLRGAIESFCSLYARDNSLVRLGLELGDSHASLWRTRPAEVASWPGGSQGEQFMLASMIRVIRLAAGPGWMPQRISLESIGSTWIDHVPELADCRLERGAPVLAIAVPHELLDRNLASPIPELGDDELLPKRLAPSESFAGSLRQAIAPLLPDFCPSLEMAADLAQTSPRTLRRRLAEESTSWREVLDAARFEACDAMLRNRDLSIAEISGELGYSDQAHLTRAFRRWAGETPVAYRRRRGY